MIDAALNLIVALPAEAKAINRLLGLERLQPDKELPLYVGANLALALCGPGIKAACRGVEFLRRINSNHNACWLNIGIAGHAELPLGQPLLASRVSQGVSGKHWLLSPPPALASLSCELVTLTEPFHAYPPAAACEMEAAGFVATALECAGLHQIQVLKIISDNRQHPASEINGKMVKRLIEDQSPIIRQLVQLLSNINDQQP